MKSIKARMGVVGLTALVVLAACAPSVDVKQGAVYQSELDTRLGSAFQPLAEMITGEWGFKVKNSVSANPPTAETVAKAVPQRKLRFSKEEIRDLFSEPGRYRVMLFTKELASETSSTGEIDSMGRTINKDNQFVIHRYAVIRAVFRDEVLVQARVWPVVEQSDMVAGTTWKKY